MRAAWTNVEKADTGQIGSVGFIGRLLIFEPEDGSGKVNMEVVEMEVQEIVSKEGGRALAKKRPGNVWFYGAEGEEIGFKLHRTAPLAAHETMRERVGPTWTNRNGLPR